MNTLAFIRRDACLMVFAPRIPLSMLLRLFTASIFMSQMSLTDRKLFLIDRFFAEHLVKPFASFIGTIKKVAK